MILRTVALAKPLPVRRTLGMHLRDGVGRQPLFVIRVQGCKSGDEVAPALTHSQNNLKPRNKRTGWSQPRWHRIPRE